MAVPQMGEDSEQYALRVPRSMLTRIIQPRLSEALGQPILIDNRGGAAGIIGTAIAAQAEPDGYTILAVPASHSVNATLYASKEGVKRLADMYREDWKTREVGDGDAPTPPLGVAAVHAQQFGREQRRLLAAGAGADLEDHVPRVVGVGRKQQELERPLALGELGCEAAEFLLGHPLHLGIAVAGEHLPRAALLIDELLVRLVGFDDRLDLGEFLADLEQALAVAEDLGVRLLVAQLLPAAGHLFEALHHPVHVASLPFATSSGKPRRLAQNNASRGTCPRPAAVTRLGWRLTPFRSWFRSCRSGGGSAPPCRQSR
ncbi:MAG: hypothetical protein B7Z61_03180 [Acidobacteria bacterium 37-71-11]|nr:MAG: hypothetical protein B7Z61_03180 [Acidobacteria bacterium 37-71-11]